MTRNEFEQKYLNKMVEVVLFDNDTFKGYLYSTNDYMNKTKLFLTEDDKKKFTSDYIDNHNICKK